MTLPQEMIERAEQAKRVDLVALAGQYTNLSGNRGEVCGPCPKCGGTDRFHVKGSLWFCRQCAPAEQTGWHDSIHFARWLKGLDYAGAITFLTGYFPEPAPVARQKPVEAPQKGQDARWVQSATRIVSEASRVLSASPGASYLSGRGLNPETWKRFNLGYRADTPIPGTEGKMRAPAIVMPWYGRTGVVGIRYRFLQSHSGIKQTAMYDSVFKGMFGKQAIDKYPSSINTLVICEGEINAMSIWQVTQGWGWSVLSLGSQDTHMPAAAVEYAKQFGRVLVWMDMREKLARIMHEFDGLAYGFASPLVGGEKADANKLLQMGRLQALLMGCRQRAAQDEKEKERAYWDVWEAVNMDGFALDDQAQSQFEQLARQVEGG